MNESTTGSSVGVGPQGHYRSRPQTQQSVEHNSYVDKNKRVAQHPKFVMDYSLNKIAKYLRLLGYDTLCDPMVSQDHIIAAASSEERYLVSCSTSLLRQVEAHNRGVLRRAALKPQQPQKHRVVAYDSDGESVYSSSSEVAEVVITVFPIKQWRSKDFQTTMIDLIREAGLTFDKRLVFSRCVTCNDVLVPVAKPLVRGRVEPRIFEMYAEFTECPVCHKVFWGFDGDQVINYKSFRTLDLLRSLCIAAGAPVNAADTQLATLKSFRSFPRKVKTLVFTFLTDEELQVMAEVFPVLADLTDEVRTCRRQGIPVAPFKAIKSCK